MVNSFSQANSLLKGKLQERKKDLFKPVSYLEAEVIEFIAGLKTNVKDNPYKYASILALATFTLGRVLAMMRKRK